MTICESEDRSGYFVQGNQADFKSTTQRNLWQNTSEILMILVVRSEKAYNICRKPFRKIHQDYWVSWTLCQPYIIEEQVPYRQDWVETHKFPNYD